MSIKKANIWPSVPFWDYFFALVIVRKIAWGCLSFQEKKVILGKLKKKEAEMEQINLQVVEQLKSQLKLEARKLEKVSQLFVSWCLLS